MKIFRRCRCAAFVMAAMAVSAAAAEAVFENLGSPLDQLELTQFCCVTRDAAGEPYIWGVYDVLGRYTIVGINMKTGRSVSFNTAAIGRARIIRSAKGGLYAHLAAPAPKGGRFYKLDAADNTWHDLGQSSPEGAYVLDSVSAPDGMIYVPSYPRAEIMRLDTNSDTILPPVKLAEDPRQLYATRLRIADDGTLYALVGLHHMEIWSWNPATGVKQQILPKRLTEAAVRPNIRLETGTDGAVYALCDKEWLRCFPDRAETVATPPSFRSHNVYPHRADGVKAIKINSKRELEVQGAGGVIRGIPTDVPEFHPVIYSVSLCRDGKLYGGSFSPARFFTYDIASGEHRDFGTVTRGTVQIYDLIEAGESMVAGSYVGAYLDLVDPETGKSKPLHCLDKTAQQERPNCFARGGNGRIYVATCPIKGRLGGELAELDPANGFALREWGELVPKQSFASVAAIPGGHLLFIGSDIAGGTSAVPEAKEAETLIFDPDTGKVVWRGKPLPGETCYLSAVTGPDGLIYGTGRSTGRYFAFDPAKRKVVKTGALPEAGRPFIARQPASDGSLIGVVGATLFRIVPGTFRLETLGHCNALRMLHYHIVLAPGNELYFGSGSNLWRARIKL